jgi:hypothetical protein
MTTTPSPKKRGRPALDPDGGQSKPVYLRLTSNEYERISRAATARRLTIPEWLRETLGAIKRDSAE